MVTLYSLTKDEPERAEPIEINEETLELEREKERRRKAWKELKEQGQKQTAKQNKARAQFLHMLKG